MAISPVRATATFRPLPVPTKGQPFDRATNAVVAPGGALWVADLGKLVVVDGGRGLRHGPHTTR